MFKTGNSRRRFGRFDGVGVQSLEGRVLLSVTPSLVANRVSGVAPLSVHFDATGTTSTATALPFHEVQYGWDFGDAESGTWTPSGNSRNTATGAVTGHVFEQPGTYTVTLNVRDGDGSVGNQTVTIDVQDPDVVFSGTNTIVFSTTGDFTGAPAGALQVTTGSLSTIVSYAAAGKRLLLHRGETWNNAASVTVNKLGPGIIGAYGTGAKPRILSSSTVFTISAYAHAMEDWRFVDLDLVSTWVTGQPVAHGFSFSGTADRILIDRVDIANFALGVVAGDSILNYYNGLGGTHVLHDGNAIVDSTITHGQGGAGGNAMFVVGRRMLILGSSFADMDEVEHVLRLPWQVKSVINDNLLSTPASAKHNLKLHAPDYAAAGLGFQQYTEQVVVAGNVFVGAANPWITTIGPQDNVHDNRVRDVIFERNFTKSGTGTQVGAMINAERVTLRNNIFAIDSGDTAINVSRRGIEPVPTDNRIYNNTVWPSSGSATAVFIASNAVNTTVMNNLVAKSGATINGTGTGLVASNNVVLATPKFVSATPVNPADFALRVDSAARDVGTAVALWNDFGGQQRPLDLYDVGAWEMVDLTAPTATIGAPTGSPANSVTITFSEAVTGFDLADLTLSRNGGANLLAGTESLTSSDGKTFVLAGLAGLTQTAGSYAITLSAAGSGIADLPGNAMTSNASQNWLQYAAVAGRWVFYNRSYWDGNDAAVNALDDGAIAPDKAALLPGQTATFANYTSYSRGINGLMVDVLGLPQSGVTASDFEFRVGNDSITPDPTTWALAAAPASVTVRTGAGAGGSDRVEIVWADNAIQKQWLQVKLLANGNTGLAGTDVFYFGNAVGESGNSTTSARVDSSDEIGARSNPKTPSNPALITDLYDYNRDHLVNSVDQLIARNNKTTPSTELKLIQAPA